MKYFILIIFTVLAFITTQRAAAGEATYEENLPLNWYTMPEDLTRENRTEWSDQYTDLNAKQQQGIDRVLHANSVAFTKMEAKYPSNHRGKWRLEACILDITLSASGVVGALVAKGQSSVALYYRNAPDRSVTVKQETVPEALDFTVDSDTPFDELESRVEPLVKSIMATGQVENEEELRHNIKEKVFDMHTIVQFMKGTPNTRWDASKLRVDLTVEVTGKVNPLLTVGGGIKIRLEWALKKHRASTLAGISRVRLEKNRKLGDGLKKIVENLTQQMQEVKYKDLTATGFDLNEVKFGLGLFGDGNVGVAKIAGSLFGYVYLTPNRAFREGTTPQWTRKYDSLPLIDESANPKWASWASEHGIPMQAVINSRGETTNVYSTPAEMLRKGLESTVKMGSKMAESASKSGGSWEVYKIKAEFQLSLSGSAGLFNLGGTGVLELVFSKV